MRHSSVLAGGLSLATGLFVVALASPPAAQPAASSGGAQAPASARWRHIRAITLDTSPAGAGLTRDVANYPLAIALDEANFDFAQARPDGADLRVSVERDGPPLPIDIEHWDAAARTALLWVRVPLVRANDAAQRLHLQWGHPDAPNISDSTRVFTRADGFIGVWHLGDPGGVVPDGVRDATSSAAHGTGINLAADARVPARLGAGLALDHDRTQWVSVAGEKRKLFDLTRHMTFSIWARARRFANKGDEARKSLPGYETMFAKGDNSWRLQKFGVRGWHKPEAELLEICVEQPPRADLCVVGKTDMAVDRWYHFVGVHDHPQVRFYVNGVLDKVETFDVDWISGDHPVGIGNQSQFPDRGRSWDGVLDEARVIDVVKDEAWIRLDYESQRDGQRVVRHGPTERRP